jgi:hypothetical protein
MGTIAVRWCCRYCPLGKVGHVLAGKAIPYRKVERGSSQRNEFTLGQCILAASTDLLTADFS